MTPVLQVLRDAAAAGVRLTLEDGRIRARGPAGSLTPALKSAIANHRDALLSLLAEDDTAAPSRIHRREDASVAPLSRSQRRLWFLQHLTPESTIYNLTVGWRLDGDLDIAALQSALNDVVARHEILRTTFVEDGDEVTQRIAPIAPARLRIEDAGSSLDSCIETESTTPFNLAAEPPVRVLVVRAGHRQHALIITMHHIASDHASMVIFASELAAAYNARVSGQAAALAPLPYQFGDYVAWERTNAPKTLPHHLDYWRQQLNGAPQLLELPTDRPRPAVQSDRGGLHTFHLDATRVAPLLALGATHGLTPFMTLLSVYALLLSRYSGQQDVVIGCPVSTRREPGSEALIGFFVDTQVLRIDLSGSPSVAALFERVRRSTVDALSHPIPFDRLVETLAVERTLSHTPIFQTMFVVQPSAMPPLRLSGLTAQPITGTVTSSEFDMTFFVEPGETQTVGRVEFRTDLFDTATIEQFSQHFGELIDQTVAGPADSVDDLTLSAGDDGATAAEQYSFDRAVHERFAAQASATPHAAALVAAARTLSYAQLDRRANQLAWQLIDAGVTPGERVGLRASSTTDFTIGVLAILRIGGAWVPLSAQQPPARAQSIIDTNRIRLVVTAELIATSEAESRTDPPAVRVQPDDVAAVYHTSGSTGTPLGVMVTHRALASHADAIRECYALTATDRVLQFAAWDFDVAVEEILPALCTGAAVIERPADGLAFADFERYIADTRASVLNLPASFWEAWVGAGAGRTGLDEVRLLIVGSERVTGPAMSRWLEATTRRIRTLNAYGTTEATITSTILEVTDDAARRAVVPIGRPLRYSSVYVLDAHGRPLPSRVAGEIWIGGSGVAAGYVNAADATAARFARDPFSTDAGARMVRTGDRGRRLADGTIEVLGRFDRQIKLRGFRIDPRDVESVVAAHPAIDQCAAVLSSRPGTPDRLAVFARLRDGAAATEEELRDFAAARLPAYMVPARIVSLEALPVTARGKVDVAALERLPIDVVTTHASTQPRTDAESILASIWSELLGVTAISVTDNFFALGGDSILGISMVSRARARGLQLKPHSLFEHQTIEGLARAATPAAPAGAITRHLGPVALSPIQRRYFSEPSANRSRYSQAIVIALPGHADVERLRDALQAVIDHHAALSYRFEEREGTWLQIAGPPARVDFAAIDTSMPQDVIVSALEDHLNLARGQMVAAAVVGTGDAQSLSLVIHHLAVDAISLSIIVDDLQLAYQQLSAQRSIDLPPATPFDAWTRRLSDAVETIAPGKWDDQLADDWDGARVPQGEAASVAAILDQNATADLLERATGIFHITMQDVLIAAVLRGFEQTSGGRRLRIDVEGHGRNTPLDDVDLTRSVGWFTTIHPISIEAPSDLSTLLTRVRDARVFSPPAFTYDLLRFMSPSADVRATLDAAGNAAVLFNYLGTWQGQDAARPWSFAPAISSRQRSVHRSHPIEINAMVIGGRLHIHWTCDASLEDRVQAWSRAAVATLQAVIDECRAISSTWRGEVEAILPLSPLQLGILSHSLRDASGRSYLDLLTVTLEGELDAADFRRAWALVLARHAALRASFVHERVPAPVQIVHAHTDLDWCYDDWRGIDRIDSDTRLADLRQQELHTPLDLTRAPLMRLRLVTVADHQHVLFWTTSHLILDGWSTSIVVREVFEAYEALHSGAAVKWPAAPSFANYIRSLDRDRAAAIAYWQPVLADISAPTPVPLGRRTADRDAEQRHEVCHATLDLDVASRVRALARDTHVSLSTVFQAAWALINRREHDQQTVMFGLTVSGRSAALDGVEAMVGTLINAVPAVITVPDDLPVAEWLRQLHAQHLERERYSDQPLTTLQRLSGVPAGIDLFESLLMVQNYPAGGPGGRSGLRVTHVIADEATNYPLSVVVEPGDAIRLTMSFEPSRIAHADAERLLQQLTLAVIGMADAPNAHVRSLALITAADRRRLLSAWSATREIAVDPAVFTRRFEQQAATTPQALALAFEDRTWTYATLDEEANRWANHLKALGSGPGVIVGVCLERSPEHVISVLAILKSGGALLPLDPAHPSSRLAMMIQDAGVAIVITSSEILNGLPNLAFLTVCVDTDAPGQGYAAALPDGDIDPDSLAYVIYTSGSTGAPKGVMGLHRGLASLAANQRELFALEPGDRVLQFAPIGFDASLWEIALALGSGAALIGAPRESLRPGQPLQALLNDARITTLTLPPSSLAALDAGSFPELRTLIVAGETCAAPLVNRWSPGRRMFNAYGPTETSVCATIAPCEANGEAPHIGKPLANFRVHLLDARLEPVPIGGIGEICVAGRGVAGGYLRRDALTRERFVNNPHAGVAYPAAGYERLYRTGDLGRYRADGTIEFIGRRDEQVKVRGFRIELGEIEAALAEHRALQQCCVVMRDDGAGKQLVAYIVPRATPPTAEQLRAFLAQSLPDYMVPVQFVTLEEMPVTANGKIARQRLPAPALASLGMDASYVAPRNPVESRLAEIWAAVLRLPRVGIHDNFFEIGGDSILAIQVVSRAAQAGVPMTLAELFDDEFQTIAAYGGRSAAGSESGSTHEARSGPFALAPIQRWFFNQAPPAPHHYNQTLLFEVPADIDRRALDRALRELRAHHDALRLRFVESGGNWTQEYTALNDEPLLEVVVLDPATDRRRAIELEAARQQHFFDLGTARVFRAVLMTFDDGGTQRLLLSAHHLVVDGVSWNILLEDLTAAYAGAVAGEPSRLPEHTAAYRQWVERLTSDSTLEQFGDEIDFWRGVEQHEAALPLDRGNRRQNPGSAAARFTHALDTDLSNAILRDVPAVYQTQINDVLLTAVATAFHAWTGDRRLVLNLEGHGREPLGGVDLTRTVGWFTSLFPVALELNPSADIGRSLRDIKQQLRAIPRRGIGYGVLRFLRPNSGLGNGASPEVSFNYLGQAGAIEAPADWLRMAAETVTGDFSPLSARPHLLDINAIFIGGRLQFDWIYNQELHDESTIRALANRVDEALRAIAVHCRHAGPVMPVTSMQEQILKHALAYPDSLAYRVEIACDIVGSLDSERFMTCWQQIVDAHPALRTTFVDLGDGHFGQHVAGRLTMPWDGSEGDPLNGPLVSGLIESVTDTRHRFTLRVHHLLLDGWSVSKVFADVLASYEGRTIAPDRAARDAYMRWLSERDTAGDLAFWRSELAGLTPRTFDPPTAPPAQETIALGTELSRQLRAFAASQQVTLNTVLFGAWALTLASLRDTDDVVIGTTFSGRNAPLAGIEDVVGMLINTLPVRVSITGVTLGAWLTTLQQRMGRVMAHSESRLSDVAHACGLPENVFDTTFRFQNYPVDQSITDGTTAIRLESLRVRDAWHYPINVAAIPGDDITIIADYFPDAHGAEVVANALAALRGIAAQLPGSAAVESTKLVAECRARNIESDRRA